MLGYAMRILKLNSIICDVENFNCQVKEHSPTVIANKMLIEVDSERFSLMLIGFIVDWKKYETTIELVDDHFIASMFVCYHLLDLTMITEKH